MYAHEEAGPQRAQKQKHQTTSTNMTTTTVVNKKTVRRKKKLTPEENGTKKWSIVPQNKYMEAFLKHQDSFIVYDPNFML